MLGVKVTQKREILSKSTLTSQDMQDKDKDKDQNTDNLQFMLQIYQIKKKVLTV